MIGGMWVESTIEMADLLDAEDPHALTMERVKRNCRFLDRRGPHRGFETRLLDDQTGKLTGGLGPCRVVITEVTYVEPIQ